MSKIIPFEYGEKQIRVIQDEESGEPLWVAKDICNALGLTHMTNALDKLDVDEKLTVKILQSGQNRNMMVVNESGLYTLILRSNKPEAKPFKRWVTHEVLPSIRKTGGYGVSTDPALFSMMAQQNEVIVQTLGTVSLMMREILDEQRSVRSSQQTILQHVSKTHEDVREIKEAQSSRLLSPHERQKLYDHVIANARDLADEYGIQRDIVAATIFGRLKNKYNIGHYAELPFEKLGEAILYVNHIDITN